MESIIQVYDFNAYHLLSEIVVEDAYVYEKINDKYTFDFTCYEQVGTQFLRPTSIIGVVNEFFRIASVNISPIEGKYEVSCEHISYELNALTPEEAEEESEELHYEGFVWDIIREILQGTRFKWSPWDDIQERFSFVTSSKGKRSRIIEFCTQFGFEARWRKFDVEILLHRGSKRRGLEIELGVNLRDLKINQIFNQDGTVEQSFDIDFINLNRIKDENGNPLSWVEFYLGDVVYLMYNNQPHEQRAVSVGFNPFSRALPTVELESPSRDIVEVIASGGGTSRGGGGGGGGVQMDSVVFAESRGILFFHANYEEWDWDGDSEVQFPITDMSEFYIDLGELTLEPNAYVRLKFSGYFDINSFKDDGGNWIENPDPIELKFFIDENSHEVMSTFDYDDGQRGTPIIIYQQPKQLIKHPNQFKQQFEFEVVFKNTIRLYDTDEEKIVMYYVFDTERGHVRINMDTVNDEVQLLVANYPDPDSITDEQMMQFYMSVIERLYGQFEQFIFNYDVIDIRQETIQPKTLPRRMIKFPLLLGVETSLSDADDYNHNSFFMGEELRLDFIGQGYSFDTQHKHYQQPPSQLGVRFIDYPYIEQPNRPRPIG